MESLVNIRPVDFAFKEYNTIQGKDRQTASQKKYVAELNDVKIYEGY